MGHCLGGGYEDEMTGGVDERVAMLLVNASLKIRMMLSDEQILRFLNKVCPDAIGDFKLMLTIGSSGGLGRTTR